MPVGYGRDVDAAQVLRRHRRCAPLHARGRPGRGRPADAVPAAQGPGGRSWARELVDRGRAGRPAPHPGRRGGAAAGPADAGRPGQRPHRGRGDRRAAQRPGPGRGHPVAVHGRAGRRAAHVPRPLPAAAAGADGERVPAAGALAGPRRAGHRAGDRAAGRHRPGPGVDPDPARAALGGLPRHRGAAVDPRLGHRAGPGPASAGRPADRLRRAGDHPAPRSPTPG